MKERKEIINELREFVNVSEALERGLMELDENKFWFDISRGLKLNEDFMEKHSDKVHWENISIFQDLSLSFVERNADKLVLKYLLRIQGSDNKVVTKYATALN